MVLPLEAIPFNRNDWEQYALCRRMSPESQKRFFPADENKGRAQAEARAVCRMCPAVAHCLQKAMAGRYEGIWGATSTAERQKIRKSRSRAKCPVCVSEDVTRIEADGKGPEEICLACGTSWPAASPSTQHRGRNTAGGAVVEASPPDRDGLAQAA